jgi:hypothetical protein
LIFDQFPNSSSDRQIAGQLDRGNEIALAFVDADRDVDIFLVGVIETCVDSTLNSR